MPPVPRRLVVLLLAAALLCVPAAAAAQTTTIPEEGSGVSTTPPVPLPADGPQTSPSRELPNGAGELPNTGADARMLFLAGLALLLIGFGLRLRTADAELY